jgi:hypothetical protein
MDPLIQEIEAFKPTNDEVEDVTTLNDLTYKLEDSGDVVPFAPALLGLFERHPNAALGSPGPIVRLFEDLEVSQYIEPLTASLNRQLSKMSLKLFQTIIGGPMSKEEYDALLKTLKEVGEQPDVPSEYKEVIQGILADHGV